VNVFSHLHYGVAARTKKRAPVAIAAGRPVRLSEGEGLRLPQHWGWRSLQGAREGYDETLFGDAGVIKVCVVIAKVEVKALE